MRERNIERTCCAYAEKRGWWHRKFKSPGRRSAPDRIFAKEGVVFFVEFKAPGEKATPLQSIEHAAMRCHGLIVKVIDEKTAFKRLLQEMQDQIDQQNADTF